MSLFSRSQPAILCISLICALPALLSAQQETISETYPADATGRNELILHLTLPDATAGDDEKTDAKDEPAKAKVMGVMAICSYSDRGMEANLGGSPRFSHLIKFAERHQMAVIAFGMPTGGWNRRVNSSDLSGKEAAEQSRKLDDSARYWSRAVRKLASRHQLPDEGWFLYGVCGGAQYAHRLAFREPDLFRAVHIHYGGSYGTPTKQAKDILWLVTTRADEPNYIAAQKFFQESKQLDYRMILKGFRTRSGDIGLDAGGDAPGVSDLARDELSRRFFEFAFTNTEKPAKVPAAYIADYVNELVMPADKAKWIPKQQAIWLPNREVAEAWGPISE